MLTDYLPVYRIRLRTARLELRLPDMDDLVALADRAAEGVHTPDFMPFVEPWTEAAPLERGRATIQWQMKAVAGSTPEDWALPFVTVHEGKVIGMQEVTAKRFGVTREATTGSWLGLAHHGQGFGTEMRAAVLAFLFEGLGADYALSASFDGNEPSAGVSRRLGYLADGVDHKVLRDQRRLDRRWRLDRERWEAHRRHEVAIEGLDEEARAALGLGAPQA
ncbi:Protein N-acetyltransferase, RimJ/RimL family [Glycomyces sambucus]|uniref:Protein N-acetyltransferase, RimJ/RimL family n=1 Tax=Glycomyces sambucus TaxID=380244 RepID=A0A1G9DBE3_9ACTN|nr:GNAT family N-acetyltransferase [Glycomyces sambucus]SDK61137.1 Protein N-acetyltransferase, RimJ/RimL family [Glycomyces sambucus]